jgi:hypothetical protein
MGPLPSIAWQSCRYNTTNNEQQNQKEIFEINFVTLLATTTILLMTLLITVDKNIYVLLHLLIP